MYGHPEQSMADSSAIRSQKPALSEFANSGRVEWGPAFVLQWISAARSRSGCGKLFRAAFCNKGTSLLGPLSAAEYTQPLGPENNLSGDLPKTGLPHNSPSSTAQHDRRAER